MKTKWFSILKKQKTSQTCTGIVFLLSLSFSVCVPPICNLIFDVYIVSLLVRQMKTHFVGHGICIRRWPMKYGIFQPPLLFNAILHCGGSCPMFVCVYIVKWQRPFWLWKIDVMWCNLRMGRLHRFSFFSAGRQFLIQFPSRNLRTYSPLTCEPEDLLVNSFVPFFPCKFLHPNLSWTHPIRVYRRDAA